AEQDVGVPQAQRHRQVHARRAREGRGPDGPGHHGVLPWHLEGCWRGLTLHIYEGPTLSPSFGGTPAPRAERSTQSCPQRTSSLGSGGSARLPLTWVTR